MLSNILWSAGPSFVGPFWTEHALIHFRLAALIISQMPWHLTTCSSAGSIAKNTGF